MDDSPVEEYRDKMTDWGLPLSQYSQQCQACFAPQSGSGLDIVENTEQGRQANQYRYPRPERRYSVFRNQGTVAPEYSQDTQRFEDKQESHELNICVNCKHIFGTLYGCTKDSSRWMLNSVWGKLYRLDIICNGNIRFDTTLKRLEDGVFNLSYLTYLKGQQKSSILILLDIT